MKKAFVLIFMLLMAFIFVGCDSFASQTTIVSEVNENTATEVTTLMDKYIKVDFDSKGGSVVESEIIEENTYIPTPSASKEGYILEGWYMSLNDGMTYDEKWSFLSNKATNSMILYAKWIINQYTITFDSNEGSSVDSITQDYNTEVIKPDNPVKEEYSFGGWFIDSELNTAYIFTTLQAEDITLYAKWNDKVYGITETSILVGNTAATSGCYATVGVPFNAAIEAVFKEVNDAGGIDGRMIEFMHYDDQYDSSQGLFYTDKLINEDKIFAIVGHFGTPTVSATLSLIQDVGIPMVYAATPVNSLYFAESIGNPVMAVQPIAFTDGRIMTARAITENIYGTNHDVALAEDATIGVLYTNDDAGNSFKAGIEAEMDILGIAANRVYYMEVTSFTVDTAVQLLKGYGVASVVLAMNQTPFEYTLTSMYDQVLEVPVFTSYINADITYVDETQFNVNRPIYTNAWVDVLSAEGEVGITEYVTCISNADLTENEKMDYYSNSFAIAGYIAARVFVEGLQRVADNGEDLTWENYIAAMEEGPIDIPMGGVVDFSAGKRWGIASMSLLQYTVTVGDNPYTSDIVETDYVTEEFIKVREITTLEEIEENE